MDEWTNDRWGSGSCCSLLKSTVKIFDIYTEESEYIQAAKGEADDLPPVRGTFGTANTQPIPTHSVLLHPFVFCPFIGWTSKSS